ncbi:MAG: anti-sigma factor family protein [Acidobacteriota bacterium]
MDEQDLKGLLQDRRNLKLQRGWRCPDEMQLAAYVDEKLNGPARESVEAHVADCDYCLSQVSFIAQSTGWTDSIEVPAPLLARARNLVPQKETSAGKWRWQWVAATAASACVILLIALIAFYPKRQDTLTTSGDPLIAQRHEPEMVAPPQVTTANSQPRPAPTYSTQKPKLPEPSTPPVRGGPGESAPRVIFPRNGATLRRDQLLFRWEPFAEAEFYEIRVVTAAGDPVFASNTEDTNLRVGSDLQLQAGAKYFGSVRAHLHEGKTTKSSLVSFIISRQ